MNKLNFRCVGNREKGTLSYRYVAVISLIFLFLVATALFVFSGKKSTAPVNEPLPPEKVPQLRVEEWNDRLQDLGASMNKEASSSTSITPEVIQ